MPYYEFESPKRLNDNEWILMLDSAFRPDIPEWIKPITGEKGIGVPLSKLPEK